MGNKSLNLDWKHYNFSVFFHVAWQKYSLEVYDYKKNWVAEPLSAKGEEGLKFDSFEEAIDHLRKYGYHNVGRFLGGDV